MVIISKIIHAEHQLYINANSMFVRGDVKICNHWLQPNAAASKMYS